MTSNQEEIVIVSQEGTKYYVEKELAYTSKVLKVMMESDFVEGRTGVAKFDDIPDRTMKLIIEFMEYAQQRKYARAFGEEMNEFIDARREDMQVGDIIDLLGAAK